ncbi:IS5 family transposase [Geminicoccaceae bacterium 1502E]|nr:IS5 family transposase [Geminicoccaceae bacterium 1502E]
MPRQPGFWSVEERLCELSAQGDPLEKLLEVVDFELFRPVLDEALGATERVKGGRPPFDTVLKLKMLYLQAQHGLSFERTEHLVRDRLSWMRFCGLSIADPVPDANTLRDFREALIRAGALDELFARLDRAIKDAGWLPMSGQIVDASLVAAPRQRNTEAGKAAIRAGRRAAEIWPDKPAKAAQKDTDARWTLKTSKGKAGSDGTARRDLAIPAFGYKSHIGIDRRHGLIRRHKLTDAAAHDGARLREGLVDPGNTASEVWADSAYRSKANEDLLADHGKRSRIHRKKPTGRPMPRRTAKANAKKSVVRAKIEHVFAQQKHRMRLMIRSIGIKRAEATVIMANIAYNLGRWRWREGRAASA